MNVKEIKKVKKTAKTKQILKFEYFFWQYMSLLFMFKMKLKLFINYFMNLYEDSTIISHKNSAKLTSLGF